MNLGRKHKSINRHTLIATNKMQQNSKAGLSKCVGQT